ncbi:tRNA (guanosine(46)-N7)-methyltransferase TrmB [Parahaliea maris]|uniref:tRNA (guanine-N(7)-)-methyltransferase n=1 Tax=Parahaliea maris TaxID=2716870 RepID=A0A5C9A395_9GAMM|nr:tRNA (guanosine(46)-N7)-methyltransferase TrmB [Parahaliea maris]TXS93811.1 tRNA (guanosine(46)-N7)-methyltransferase TrmB [Parahaliea maris]
MSEPKETTGARHRPIRSYVLRTGRMTDAQKRAFDAGWQRWGVDYSSEPVDPVGLFGRDARLVLEIGFGMGRSLATMAAADPEADFIGIEVHTPGVGRLLHTVEEEGIDNIRVWCHDAVEVLEHCIAPGTLDTVQIFFPDPWHKKRHHKRRLIQPAFVELLVSRLAPGGVLHLATDWENYAEQMMEVLSANGSLENMAGPGEYSPRPEHRPLTKFEQRGERLGHGVWDLLFRRS